MKGFILAHIVFYLLGSFIAWDLNPMHWWMFTSSIGRILFIIWEIFVINASFDD
jgi:hypothetical protein